MTLPIANSADLPWIDIHCHCLPGIDDGPNTPAGALELCRKLVEQGVGQVVATPHQLGRYEGRNLAADVRTATATLQTELDREGVPLRIHAGGEVRIDPAVGTLLQRDKILTLADGRKFLLLELPLDVMVNPLRLVAQLASEGITTILAHVERYPSVVSRPDSVIGWIQSGASLQVNGDSLLGAAGRAVEECAWELLRRGSVSVIASDAHDAIRRPPRFAELAEILAQEIGASPARQLLRENPERILKGQPLKPVVAFVDRSADA